MKNIYRLVLVKKKRKVTIKIKITIQIKRLGKQFKEEIQVVLEKLQEKQ